MKKLIMCLVVLALVGSASAREIIYGPGEQHWPTETRSESFSLEDGMTVYIDDGVTVNLTREGTYSTSYLGAYSDGSAYLNMSGSGQLLFAQEMAFALSDSAGAVGAERILTMSGTSYMNPATLYVGMRGDCVINITDDAMIDVRADGTLYTPAILLGNQNYGPDLTATINQSGNSIIQSLGSGMDMGANNTAIYNMDGGQLILGGTITGPGEDDEFNLNSGTIILMGGDYRSIVDEPWFHGTAIATYDGTDTTIIGISTGTVTPLDDPMQVLESDVDGSAVQFTVELSGDFPVTAGDTITLTVDISDPNNGVPNQDMTIETSAIAASNSTIELTFTDSTWNIPQTVTVKAIDDAIVDDSYAEVHLVSFSTRSALGDSNYGGTDGSDPDAVPFSGPLGVTVIDDETPSITISKTSVSVSEDGTVDSYTIALQTDPTDTVTVDIIADCQATVTASLTFSAGDLGPKTVTVGAVDDSMVEVSPHAGTISHVVTTTDAGYAAAGISDVAVSITDNDARVWNFGDDVVVPITNNSFEDPALSDGGVADVNDVDILPGYDFWVMGGSQMQVINPDAAAWSAMYNAGHQQAPDGDQILDVPGSSGFEGAFSVCEYLIEPGPVSYSFELSVGVPNPVDESASLTVYLSSNDPATFGRIAAPVTLSLSNGDLVAGEWVNIKVCGDIEADSDFIGGVISYGIVGQGIQVDNFRLLVGNHPCDGCYLDIATEQGDLNDDCKVDMADFAIMAASWMDCYLYPECMTSW